METPKHKGSFLTPEQKEHADKVFDALKSTIKTDNSQQIQKLEAEKAELLEALEETTTDEIDYEFEFVKLKSLVLSDSVFWCLRRGIKYPSDFDFDDNGYIELNEWIKVNQ